MSQPGGTRTGLVEKAMNVEQIVGAAAEPFFDPQFSMLNWFRTADLMLKQASIYEHEGDDQMAYFLLYRHAHLVLDDLGQHPHFRDPEYRQAWAEARKAVRRSLAKLEILKPRINRRYERHEERRRSAATRGDARKGLTEALTNDMRRMSLDAQGSRNASPARLDAEEHQDLAVDLANRELRRRAQRDQGINEPQSLQDVSARMIETRRQMEVSSKPSAPSTSNGQTTRHTAYNYPGVPEKSRAVDTSRDSYHSSSSTSAPLAPPRLLKESSLHSPKSLTPPSLPSKTAITPSSLSITQASPAPPQSRQFAFSSTLENGTPLRTMFLPTPLRHTFLRLAAPNTRRNLETCGILLGTLISNALFITHLLIPQQTSTSDTCEMINETALYEYCDAREGLMVLGWIHTHPSQTCFMSSRDLHTHVWYQVQLAESVAIVCAPSKSPDWGIFRLTDPPGVSAIRTCKQPGIFHPHAENHIFTDALGRPGHVIEHEELQFEVVDLRPEKGN